MTHWLLELYVLAVGLVVGSYLNVVIHRLPRGGSTILPRSRCPRCRVPIKARDNLPLVSYLLLRGRCRSCGQGIPGRYPLVEAASGVVFVGAYQAFGLSVAGLVAVGFCSAMIALAVIDVEHYLLPDAITLPGVVAGLALQPWIPWTDFVEAVLGAVLGGGLLLAVAGIWYLLRRVHAMGMGDVKMLAMIGAFLGWPGALLALFVGSLAGSTVGLGLILVGRLGMRSKLPFGAFLALGAVVALFVGRSVPWAPWVLP